ncbi:MAG: hypothetical protein RLZZ216_2658 [Cyanobacteriota bacterium]|jgi:hypothetical protein
MTADTGGSPYSQAFGSQLESSVAKRYSDLGFTVTVEPSLDLIPFDLGGYRPDMLAIKQPDQNYIIEVKGSSQKISVDRIREISEVVKAHPGWRFLLVTGDDEVSIGEESMLLQSEQIKNGVKKAKSLIEEGFFDAAFLFLWSLLEGMMRRQSIQKAIPIERLGGLSLINHLYSQGEMTREQFHECKDLLSIRNRVAHGYQDTQMGEGCHRLLNLVLILSSEWT